MTRSVMLMVCVVVAFSGCDPQAAPKLPAEMPELPAEKQAAGEKPAASKNDDEPKTAIVRSLLDTIEKIDDDAADDFDNDENTGVKKQIKRSLREADKDLRNILGKNSKRKIMEANKKPPIPVIVEPTAPPASKKPEKDKPKEKGKPTEKVKGAKPATKDAPATKSE